MRQILHLIVAFGLLLVLAGCSEAGYYLQSLRGHLAVMSARQSIEDLLDDAQTPASLRARLETVQTIRRFAVDELALPDNDSFSTYADIGREAVVWSVVAAPDDSLEPVTWCFPFAGCVPYRGYFARQDADDYAGNLRSEGYDVLVGEVPAYSTLGWFSDPVLNTFIDYPDWLLAEVIVHELAHQVVYTKDDADFNEAFAQAVMEEGGRRWLAYFGSAEEREQAQQYRERQKDFAALIAASRSALLVCYGSDASHADKLNCKQKTLSGMRRDYDGLRTAWGGYSGYDFWFEHDFNNARFVSAATYTRLVPAFARLLKQHEGNMDAFYAAVRKLAALPYAERHAALDDLIHDGG